MFSSRVCLGVYFSTMFRSVLGHSITSNMYGIMCHFESNACTHGGRPFLPHFIYRTKRVLLQSIV